jgi:hypothetical protein
MEFVLKNNNFKGQDVDYQGILSKINSGKAVVFLGAGFSMSGININNKNLMTGRALSRKLCNLSGTKESDNLRFASDYYIDQKGESSLIEILLQEYTVKETSEYQKMISSLNWRRCYTTNYDHSFEEAAKHNGINVQSVDIECDVKDYYKRGRLCVHLNGSINSLNQETLNSTFKLSDSSYCSPDSFIESEWNYYFKKDMDFASAIFFIGYSLYDIEIKSILFQTPGLKDKTYFITSSNEDEETKYTLKKYGTVIPLGVEGFVQELEKTALLSVENNEYILSCF